MAYSSSPRWRSASPIGTRGPGGPSRRCIRSEKICENATRSADFSGDEPLFFFLRPRPRADCFFESAARLSAPVAPVTCLGMAIFFRIEKSHQGAVERLAMGNTVAIAAQRVARAAVPHDGGRAGRHECDAGGHQGRARAEGARARNGKIVYGITIQVVQRFFLECRPS